LIGIWEEVLGRNGIGIHDNFFDLGGHSLKATRLAGHIHKEFGVKISIKDIFQKPVISLMSDIIRASNWIKVSQEDYSKSNNAIEI
ncbi:phosphopantetheine-binding protein, partial [Mucilaginibacter angelicae]